MAVGFHIHHKHLLVTVSFCFIHKVINVSLFFNSTKEKHVKQQQQQQKGENADSDSVNKMNENGN